MLDEAQKIFRRRCYARGIREGREEIETGLDAMTDCWLADPSAGIPLLLLVARQAVINQWRRQRGGKRRPMPLSDPVAPVEPGIAEWAEEKRATNPVGAEWLLARIAAPNHLYRRLWSKDYSVRESITRIKRLLAADFGFRRSRHKYRNRPEPLSTPMPLGSRRR